MKLLQAMVLRMITAYRNTGGGRRWFGIDCNFEPSCSAYAHQAIERFGLYRGFQLTCNRLRRCKVRDAFCKCHEPVPDVLKDAE